jgi:hypothetical protein
VPGEHIDSGAVHSASRATWGPLLAAGAVIAEHRPTMYHCKVMVVDERLVFERHAGYSVFTAPLIFIAAKPSCSETSAQASVCQPHTAHRALLSRKTQNPVLRRVSCSDAISHDAKRVTAMAGHCNKPSKSINAPAV